MMNQSEIDAGPPNKKPKIGTSNNNNISSTNNVINITSSSAPVVNGLSAQMSETGLCISDVRNRFVNW